MKCKWVAKYDMFNNDKSDIVLQLFNELSITLPGLRSKPQYKETSKCH